MSGLKTEDVWKYFLVSDTRSSKISAWYVDKMLGSDVESALRMMEDPDRDGLEFAEILTRLYEVVDTEKLKRAYELMGLMLSMDGISKPVERNAAGSGEDVKKPSYSKGKSRSDTRETLSLLRENVSSMLNTSMLDGTREKTVRLVDPAELRERLNNVIGSEESNEVDEVGTDREDNHDVGDSVETGDVVNVAELNEKEREWFEDGYVRNILVDDSGVEREVWSKGHERLVHGYMAKNDVSEYLGKSIPYVNRISRMIGMMKVKNRSYADVKLVERVRSEMVSHRKVGESYMSVTDFAIAASMTRRGAMRVIRGKLPYKERNGNLFVKRNAANKFIRENAESVPNPFEYVTMREIEYTTGIMITSEYSDSESLMSGLAVKYRNNRMLRIDEFLRMLEARGKQDTFDLQVRNEMIIEYMREYLELSDEEAKNEFRKEAGIYGKYLRNLDDMVNPSEWFEEMLADETYMKISRVLATV